MLYAVAMRLNILTTLTPSPPLPLFQEQMATAEIIQTFKIFWDIINSWLYIQLDLEKTSFRKKKKQLSI